METAERPTRKYVLTKIAAGDYLLPSNDGKTLWRIYRGQEDDGDIGRGPYEVWQVWKYLPHISLSAPLDPDEWAEWGLWESYCKTRQEAVDWAVRQ